MQRLGCGILVLFLALVVATAGQTAGEPAPTADTHYQAGRDRQTQADLSASQEDARQLYTQAVAEYQEAARLQPDHYHARLYWGVCLAQLAVLDPDPGRAQQHLLGANQQFTSAADCPGADHVVFEQWANLLLGNLLALVPEPADRLALLREASKICERGLTVAREPGPRAQLAQHLGRALRLWADLTSDPAERQALRQRADDHLRVAGQAITAQQRCEAGAAKQAAAEMADTPAAARRLYREAIAEYESATRAQPDHYPSHLFWGTCLAQLVPLAGDAEERLRLARDAEQQFATASQCPESTAVVFDQWASLLVGTLYPLISDRTEQRALLRQSADVCRRGLPLATEPTPRAQLERQLGSALMWMVEFTRDAAEKRVLLEQAIDHLHAANQVVTVRQTLYQNGYLGIAHLSLGRLVNDAARLRAAAAEFEDALRFYPHQVDTRYNLAATYSLLGDAAQAGKQLALVIDHDPDGTYYRLAARDPDLAGVRDTAAYRAALDRRRRQAAEAQAATLLGQARAAQHQAESTNDLSAARALWGQVAAFCEQAIRFTPDQFPAQALCATALDQLGQLSTGDPDQHQRYLDAAREQFAAAARCAGVDATFYDRWAAFLLDRYRPNPRAAIDRSDLLAEARQVLADGIARARFSGLRGQLESRLGCCLVLLAQLTPEIDAAPLYREAVKHFETAAAATDSITQSPQAEELWGWALLRTGQASRDKLQIRRGIDRFVRSLEQQPGNSGAQYGLACAYGQLRQFDLALRHLERCLQNDPQGVFQRRAERDADLRALRLTEGYARLVGQRPSLDSITRPTISVK